MKILALETSAKAVSAAVTEDGKVLCSGYQDTGLTHSRTLMPIVDGMLKNTGLTVRDCDAIAVSVGPGSFTGIRIGVAAAKGLAFAAEKPTVAVSTLEAMARNVAHVEGLIICAMALPDLAEEVAAMEGPRIVLGDGASLCLKALEDQNIFCRLAPPQLIMQNAVSVALCAGEAALRGGLIDPQALAPVYLRPPQALPLRDRQ